MGGEYKLLIRTLTHRTPSSDCLGGIFDLTQGSSIEAGSGNPNWVVGDVFLKNVYSVYRLSPPSVGFAQLSSAAGGGSGASSASSSSSAADQSTASFSSSTSTSLISSPPSNSKTPTVSGLTSTTATTGTPGAAAPNTAAGTSNALSHGEWKMFINWESLSYRSSLGPYPSLLWLSVVAMGFIWL